MVNIVNVVTMWSRDIERFTHLGRPEKKKLDFKRFPEQKSVQIYIIVLNHGYVAATIYYRCFAIFKINCLLDHIGVTSPAADSDAQDCPSKCANLYWRTS